jgi:transforming growth factor-beta-induced protein
MSFSLIKKIAATLSTVAILAGTLIVPTASAAAGDIVDKAITSAPEFSTLVQALTAADLVTTLQGAGPFTVVAPTNAAFAALPSGVLAKLLLPVNKPELVKILTYHVVSGNFNSTALTTLAGTATPTANTVEGSPLRFTVVGTALKINTNTATPVVASVVTPNVSATNGIIHAIDTVLLPASFNPANLQDAPTSGGGTITIGGTATTSSTAAPTNNIVQTAVAAPTFSTLVAAVKAAGLVDTLSGTGPFTVLAPTNDAFAKVPADVLAKLLLPENKDALVKVLTYHVISGKVDASQVVKLTSAKTVQGSNVKIAVVDGKVKLNDNTTVLSTDIQTSNGIIHSIDSVLLPSDLDLTKLVSAKAAVTTTPTTTTSTTTVEAPKTDSMKGDHTIRTGGEDTTIITSVIALISIVILGFATKFAFSKKNS